MNATTRSTRRDQRGSVIIWMALFMVTMLGCVALGVDMAKLMATRNQLQTAADAAALAGAMAFKDQPDTTLVKDNAVANATTIAGYNKAYESTATPVELWPADVSVSIPDTTVTVTARRDTSRGTGMVTQFLQVLGLGKLTMTATATAKAHIPGCNLVPLAVQGPLGGWDSSYCNNTQIKVGAPNGSQGSYFPIQFDSCPDDPCGGGGAALYSCDLAFGYPCCTKVGDCLPSEQGNMPGPTKAAIDARFDRDSDKLEGICYEDYHGNGARVVVAPITGPKNSCTHQGFGGYPVIGLGRFFFKSRLPHGSVPSVTAQFLGFTGAGGNGGPFTVQLIR